MKTYLLALITITSTVLLLGQGYQNSDFEHFCSQKMKRQYHNVSTLDIDQSPLLHCYDVKFYLLDINVENYTTFLSGDVTISAQVVAPVLDTFAIELIDELMIDQVFVNDIEHSVIHENNEAFIPLTAPVQQNSNFSVKIIYEGQPPTSESFSGIFSEYDSTWNKHVTWTLSEPFSARQWWPTKQVLTDKADSVWVNITTSSENLAGSIGLLSSAVPLVNNKTRFEWRSRYPIAYYLISFAVSEYEEYNIYAHPIEMMGDSILIQNFVYDVPGCLEYYKDVIDATAEMVEMFSDIYYL